MDPFATRTHSVETLDAKAQVCLLGDWELREFAAATAEITAAHDWLHMADLEAACEILDDCQQSPELIFLAQPQPGLYRQAEIDRLQRLLPLTRLVVVAGSWCEGELRTGTPPDGVIRLYWYEFASWWRAAVGRRDAGICPLWSLPLDHPQAGRWSSVRVLISQITPKLSVLIDATDYAAYETLSAALGEFAITSSCSWNGQRDLTLKRPTVNAGIWDGGQLGEREAVQLTQFCNKIDGPVVALLDFPRVEHLEQTRAAGAVAVFAKPYVVEELVQTFEQSVKKENCFALLDRK